ncbi:hypothetical protein BS17DRAFT_416756 [Gyrodon lividus]|nr:hypothetical protein BS17DRAFT_416756 [Gyrodon lividus]
MSSLDTNSGYIQASCCIRHCPLCCVWHLLSPSPDLAAHLNPPGSDRASGWNTPPSFRPKPDIPEWGYRHVGVTGKRAHRPAEDHQQVSGACPGLFRLLPSPQILDIIGAIWNRNQIPSPD